MDESRDEIARLLKRDNYVVLDGFLLDENDGDNMNFFWEYYQSYAFEMWVTLRHVSFFLNQLSHFIICLDFNLVVKKPFSPQKERNGIYIPLSQVQKTWRLAKVILKGPLCKFCTTGDIVCFPDDKGIKVDNIKVAGHDEPLRNCLFLSETRFFGVCDSLDQDDSRTE